MSNNVVVGNFRELTQIEEALQELRERELDDLIAVGFKDGVPVLIHTDLASTDPLAVIGFMEVSKDYIKKGIYDTD